MTNDEQAAKEKVRQAEANLRAKIQEATEARESADQAERSGQTDQARRGQLRGRAEDFMKQELGADRVPPRVGGTTPPGGHPPVSQPTPNDDPDTDRRVRSKNPSLKNKAAQAAKDAAVDTTKQAAKSALRTAAKAAAQLAKQVAAWIVRAILFNPWTWVAILVLALLIGLFFFISGAGYGLSGLFGNRVQNPVGLTEKVDARRIGRVTQLGGGIEAKLQNLEVTAEELQEYLTKLEERIKLMKDEKVRSEGLAKLEEVKAAAEKFIEATKKIKPEETQDKGKHRQLPPFVTQARDELLAKLKELRKIISKLNCEKLDLDSHQLFHLPKSAAYGRYDPSPESGVIAEDVKWGNPKLICFLEQVGNEWLNRHGESLKIEIGDMSTAEGGNAGRHGTHTGGYSVDIWAPKIVYHEAAGQFDANLAIEFGQILWDYGAHDVIFNDPTVRATDYEGVAYHPQYGQKLSRYAGGHENHWHVDVR